MSELLAFVTVSYVYIIINVILGFILTVAATVWTYMECERLEYSDNEKILWTALVFFVPISFIAFLIVKPIRTIKGKIIARKNIGKRVMYVIGWTFVFSIFVLLLNFMIGMVIGYGTGKGTEHSVPANEDYQKSFLNSSDKITNELEESNKTVIKEKNAKTAEILLDKLKENDIELKNMAQDINENKKSINELAMLSGDLYGKFLNKQIEIIPDTDIGLQQDYDELLNYQIRRAQSMSNAMMIAQGELLLNNIDKLPSESLEYLKIGGNYYDKYQVALKKFKDKYNLK